MLLTLAGFGVTAYEFERARRLKQVDESLHQRVSALLSSLRGNTPGGNPPEHPGRREGAPPPPMEEEPPDGAPKELRINPLTQSLFGGSEGASYYYVVWHRDGKVFGNSTNAPAAIRHPDTARILAGLRVEGNRREAFEATPPGECLLAGKYMESEAAELRQFAWSLSGIGGVILLLGLAGGWWLASRAIRPIESISAAAAKISAGDLSQRIDTEDAETELGRLAGVLNSTFARLEAAFAQQGRFTADAAHELRTPLSVILLQAQTALKNERTASEYRTTLEACQRSAQRMKTLLESLLELARLDAGQEPMKQRSCDLAAVMGECADLIEPLAAQKGLVIRRELNPTPYRGDAGRLAQVFTNLLNNAIQYNREKGSLRISTSRLDDHSAVVIVEDTGVGIAEEDLPKLFERFFRADKARTNLAGGHSGLGLAICKSIVSAHGGKMEVTSKVGEGTQVRVILPMPEGRIPTLPPERDSVSRSNLRISGSQPVI